MRSLEKIKIQIHPRAFTAFGEDLVTNDLVAMTELIKNCYDAFASSVRVSFCVDNANQPYIKVEDDGCGMTYDTIVNAWATLATPYKKKNPTISKIINGKSQTRVVSGNKGLGRFSAARLGDELQMITKHEDGEYLEATFDWTTFGVADSISDCFMKISKLEKYNFIDNNPTGTCIIIKKLKAVWNDIKIAQLKSDLSRLINPFEEVQDFKITINSNYFNEPIEVKPQSFINNPIYKIVGSVSEIGDINWHYVFNSGKSSRERKGIIEWDERNYPKYELFSDYICGEFSFEIRAWDLDVDSIADVASRFDIGKREIRKNIGVYKGLSVYRDSVLVLPKSESSRDWLGLDAKRISQIGRRISTSQIVGIINISNKNNPEIKDTTDREKLVDNSEYSQFVQAIYEIVGKLEIERLKDKVEVKKATLSDIIAPLSSKQLVLSLEENIRAGKSSSEILEIVKDYDAINEKQLSDLNGRLVYYAQTASLGSVAMVIMHEFLTGMTVLKRFLNKSKSFMKYFDDRTKEYLNDAENSHLRITEVSQSFAPLYRRDLRSKKNISNLEQVVKNSIRLVQAKKISKGINFILDIPPEINVRISESELQTILINLLDNACYWVKESKNQLQEISVTVENGDLQDLINIVVSDSGINIFSEDAEKIFMPGVTSKPHGIGMGLVIVSELLNYYGNKIGIQIPSNSQGATFVFDLHLAK